MTYQVLARAYRPQQFEDVVGQEHVTRTLTRSFENDRLGHAYIFSGPRGIGKTTTARLLAKLVNCETPDGSEPCNSCESCEEIRESRSVDVMEIDGASNNSVDQIRELRENVQYAPANNRKKIYIIDEVHMLSKSAFNALLKTLEEPPEHVIFIFATTEIEKVPDTILSRCQRYDFRLIPLKKLVDSLGEICGKEEIPVEKEALFLIARFAEGSLRDAQSILDQMINFTGAGEETLTGERVSETWGLAPYDELLSYLKAIKDSEADQAVNRLHQHVSDGNDLTSLIADLTEMIRNLTLLKADPEAEHLQKTVPGEVLEELRELSDAFTNTELSWTFDEFIDLHEQLSRNSRFQLQLAEVGLIRIIQGRPKYNLSEIVDRLEQLEDGPRTVESEPTPSEQPNDPSPSDTKKQQKTEPNPKEDKSEGNNGDENSPSLQPPDTDSTEPTSDESSKSDQAEQTAVPENGKPTEKSSETEPETENETVNKIIRSTAQPAGAYLRESNQIRIDGDDLIVEFSSKWQNHAQNLQKDENMVQLREAIEEVMDRTLKPVIDISGDTADDPPNENRAPEPSTSKDNKQDDNRLLEQTKEVFDVENVRKLDDS